MNNQVSEGQAFITFSQAAEMSRSAGLNDGLGISPSTIRRWAIKGYARSQFPITRHPFLTGQIKKGQWEQFIAGSPSKAYSTASVQREVERRQAFLGGAK